MSADRKLSSNTTLLLAKPLRGEKRTPVRRFRTRPANPTRGFISRDGFIGFSTNPASCPSSAEPDFPRFEVKDMAGTTRSSSRAADAVDELMIHCKKVGLKRSRLLSRVYRFHRRNPALLDFKHARVGDPSGESVAFHIFEMLWHHARWVLTYISRVPGETFSVSQNFMPHYSRLAIILFPEFNGFYRIKKAHADADFGLRIAHGDKRRFARLEWQDGTAIESGWRPSTPHAIPTNPVPRRPPVKRTATLPPEVQRHAG